MKCTSKHRGSYPPGCIPVTIRLTPDEWKAFDAICAEDGYSTHTGLSVLAKYASALGTLFPMGKQEAPDESVRRELRRMCLRLGIIEPDETGEEWKNGDTGGGK